TVVDDEEARALAGRKIKRAVRPEREAADRMAGKLLWEIFNKDVFGVLDRPRCRCIEPRKTPENRTSGRVRAGRVRTAVAPRGNGRPRVAGVFVERVQYVHVRPRGKLRIELEPEQPTVPEVLH